MSYSLDSMMEILSKTELWNALLVILLLYKHFCNLFKYFYLLLRCGGKKSTTPALSIVWNKDATPTSVSFFKIIPMIPLHLLSDLIVPYSPSTLCSAKELKAGCKMMFRRRVHYFLAKNDYTKLVLLCISFQIPPR